jgi:signal transduction histidine kinase
MRTLWWRRALQQRLGTLAGAVLILWTIGTAIAASIATDRIVNSILAERHTRALGIASRIDLVLEDDLKQLDRIAGASMVPSGTASVVEGVRAVRLAESVLRVASNGQIIWARSVLDGREVTPIVTRLPHPPGGRWHASMTNVVTTSEGPRVFLVLPARESDPVGGALAATIAPDASGLRGLVDSYAAEPYRVAVLDEMGREIAATRAEPTRDGDVSRGESDAPQLSASAPVSYGPWQVRLTQPRADAIAPVLTLRGILVGSSLLLLPFAVLVALATARSIRMPVLAMTSLAERLARGEFAEPIPPAGEDEIGRLALALEQLRHALEGDERRSLLLRRIITAQEEERRRIARELHDETTQQLTALALQLDSVAAAHPTAGRGLASAHLLVRSMIDDLHRVIYDLRPSVLDDLGLIPAIRSYAETHLESRGVKIHCEFPASIPTLSRDATTALYRVVQEALTNVVRHARAESVFVGCTVTDDSITFEIEDDGAGFEPERMERPRESGEGLGLLGMRERLALLGGRCHIDSEPGAGTRIVTVLPLQGNVEVAAA